MCHGAIEGVGGWLASFVCSWWKGGWCSFLGLAPVIIIIAYFIVGRALKEVKSKIASCPFKNSSIELIFSYLYPIAIAFAIMLFVFQLKFS